MDSLCEVKSVECIQVKRGDHVLIKGHPCRVEEVGHAKPGKHGSMKARIVGRDLITETKRDFMDSGHKHIPTFVPIRKQEFFVGLNGEDELLDVFALDEKKAAIQFTPFNLAETEKMAKEGCNDDAENFVVYCIVPTGIPPKLTDIFLVQSIGPKK